MSADPSSTAARPAVSVILPAYDERWPADRVIRTWAQQDVDPASFEILAVADPALPGLRERMRRGLRPGDRLIEHPGRLNEPAFYNIGAREARGDLLVIAELHVMAEPTTVRRTIGHFAETADSAAIFACASVPGTTALGRLEHRVFEHECEPGRYPIAFQFSVRGAAIRRRVWRELGGLNESYHRTSELDFALRLERVGGTIGRIDGTRLLHMSQHDVQRVRRAMILGGLGLARLAGSDPVGDNPRVPHVPAAVSPTDLSRRGATDLLRLRADRILRGSAGRLEAVARSGTDALSALFGPAWAIARSELEAAEWMRRSRRHQAAGRIDEAVQAYRRAMVAWSMRGFVESACEHDPATWWQAEGDDATLVPAAVDRGCLIGFFEREEWGGRPMCWSDATCAVRVRLGAGRWRVGIDCESPVAPQLRDLRFRFDGRRLSPRFVDGGIELDLGRSSGGASLLGWSCAPYVPAQHGSSDCRKLGLAVAALRFRRVCGPMG